MKYIKIGILSVSLLIGIIILTPFFQPKINTNKVVKNTGNLVLEKASDNNTITYSYKSGTKIIYSWIFDKKEIENHENLNLDMDFESEFLRKTVDLNNDMKILSFDHHGLLPKNTKVKVYVKDKYNPYDKINMYYYDEDIELLRYKDSYTVDKEGYILVNLDHCSDYLLTATIVQDAANNPQNINIVIMVLIGIIILLIAVSLFSSSKK